MSRSYYYLVSGLPDLLLDEEKLPSSFRDFTGEIIEQVADQDAGLIRILRLPYDHENLIALLENKKHEFNTSGNYSEEELAGAVKYADTVPEYMLQLIEAHKERKPLFPEVSWEDQLSWLFYEWTATQENSFINEYFTFDLNLRNLLSAVNCRKFNKPLEQYIITGNEVAETILRSNAPDFSLSSIIPWAERVVALATEDLADYEKQIDLLRWEILNEITVFSYFQIDTILAFCIKLSMVQRWYSLKPEEGRLLFDKLVEELTKSFSASNDLNTVGGK
jgi:hypothetical protein